MTLVQEKAIEWVTYNCQTTAVGLYYREEIVHICYTRVIRGHRISVWLDVQMAD